MGWYFENGGHGYCGIMCNYHPKLYAWLAANYEDMSGKADFVQSVIGTFGFTETGLPYLLSAKYHMNLCGIPTYNYARHRDASLLTDYVRDCMRQMKYAADCLEKQLEYNGKRFRTQVTVLNRFCYHVFRSCRMTLTANAAVEISNPLPN